LIRKKERFDGFLVGIYICGYGFVRFFIEFFREPDYQLGLVLGFMSMGQVLCLLMMAAGIGILIWRKNAA
jgi:phosphatidylglycerol:prolipoprotein diacylglycerol transferase